MTLNMRRDKIQAFVAVIGLLCLFAVFSPLRAQDEERPRERSGDEGRFREQSSMDVVSFEPHMFAADSELVRVDILYRVRYDFFVFTRDFSADMPSYRAHGELLIELIDSTDTSISRKVQAISLTAQDNEITRLRLRYYQGSASFVVHPGRFTSVYRIEDKESQREFGDRKQILRVSPFHPGAVVRSTVLFVEPASQPLAERNFTALNDNNAAQFSKNTGTFITLKDGDAPLTGTLLVDTISARRERTIRRPGRNNSDRNRLSPFTASVRANKLGKRRVRPGQQCNDRDRLFSPSDFALETRAVRCEHSYFRRGYCGCQ